ncbi:MAG: glycosyltransferase family 2 protein [Thermoplasmata archaeon]|nr:glycosyltransferase family 2 protein [Thermoplasmata archaeon]
MLAGWLVAAILVASVVVVLYQGLAIAYAIQMPRLDRPGPRVARIFPKISVVVAARNEELDLPECLDGLLRQDYPELEIVVVDGGSEDRTREVARARAPRIGLMEEPPLPAGWVGKNWACHTGAQAMDGDWLLFTDADMRYDPGAIRAAFEWAEREKADLVTLQGRVEMVGFWERMILPFHTQMVLAYFRVPRVNHDSSRAAVANGQFTLVRRSAYLSVGGHEAVRGAVLEDVRLAQQFRRAGLRLRVAWAPDLLSTRMYRDRRELFEGLLRNVHGTRFAATRQVGFLVGLIGLFWLPLVVLPLGLWYGSLPLIGMGAFLWVALFGKHVAFSAATKGSASYGLLFPASVGFYVVLVGVSLVRGLRGRPIAWKGRNYALES